MTSGKSFPEPANEEIRGYLREVVAAKGDQSLAAEAMGVSQGYLSDVLRGHRGLGAKLLAGLATVRPELAGRLLALRAGGRPIRMPRVISVPDDVAATARGILQKRGWSDAEIDAGSRRAKLTTQSEAEDPVAVADAWELPLAGRSRPERRPKSLAPTR